jgi:hypothetical protein
MARLDENDSSPRDDEREQLELIGGTSATSTVVVGVDGSGTSIDALSWACGEARRLGGRAIAVLACSRPPPRLPRWQRANAWRPKPASKTS